MIKNVKFIPSEVGLHHLLSDLSLGDLVCVQYRDKASYEGGWTEEVYTGFITKLAIVSDDNPAGLLQMWCIETGSFHIISPKLDKIGVISESR